MKWLILTIFGILGCLSDHLVMVWLFIFWVMLFVFCSNGTVFMSSLITLDSLSFFLVYLSVWIFFLSLLGGMSDLHSGESFSLFSVLFSTVFLFLVGSFSFNSVLLFYVSFEFIFVIFYFYILGWGSSPERVKASFYMIFYTLVVSMPFLLFLVSHSFAGSLTFFNFGLVSSFWWCFGFLVFLVKFPVYGVHLWLPKAHVEAPLAGSMMLAGVLLKLGGFGLIRFFGLFFWGGMMSFYGSVSDIFILVGLFGSIVVGLLCLRQVDLKALVAYSSVLHMGMCLVGVSSMLLVGYTGGVYMLISHGFCSSAMFSVVYFSYERVFSRSLLLSKGGLLIYPILGFWWFVFSAFNMGVPPSLSFFSEVSILISCMSYDKALLIFLFIVLVLSGVYCIFFYVGSMHGFVKEVVNSSLSTRENMLMVGLSSPIVSFPFFSSFFMWVFQFLE